MGCERRGQSQGPLWVQSIRQEPGWSEGLSTRQHRCCSPLRSTQPAPQNMHPQPLHVHPAAPSPAWPGGECSALATVPFGLGTAASSPRLCSAGAHSSALQPLLSLSPVWELGTAPTGQRTRCWGTCCPAPSSRLRLSASAMSRALLGARDPPGCVPRGWEGLISLLPLPRQLRESRLPPVVPCSRPGRIRPAPHVPALPPPSRRRGRQTKPDQTKPQPRPLGSFPACTARGRQILQPSSGTRGPSPASVGIGRRAAQAASRDGR